MRPVISQLTKHLYTERIADHSVTKHYPAVRGVGQPLTFLTHDWPEETLGDTASKCNALEAQFAARLARYLLQNGYDDP